MTLLSKETLIGAGALGAGAVIAKVVHTKVLPLTKVSALATNADGSSSNLQNLITLGVGIFTPMAVKGPIGKGLGAGMIAVSVAGLVTPLLSKAGIPVTGYDNYMGNVLMGETDSSNGVLMGATEDIFTANGQDYTSSSAGEADF
jgi:hypothetical protein